MALLTGHPSLNVRHADRVGFSVASLAEALRFWVEGLGARPVRTGEMGGEFLEQVTCARGARVRRAVVSLASQAIELLDITERSDPWHRPRRSIRASRISPLIVDDLDAVLSRIAGYGWRVQGAPQPIMCGERIGTRVVYAVGPDGATIEFMQPPPAASSARRASSINPEGGCRISEKDNVIQGTGAPS